MEVLLIMNPNIDPPETLDKTNEKVYNSDINVRVNYAERELENVKDEVYKLKERVEDIEDNLEILEKESSAIGERRNRIIEQLVILAIGGIISTLLSNLLG